MTKYLVKYYNVHPVTFRKSLTSRIVEAYDQRHAVQIIDRHPQLIKQVININK
jgi:hypothetical protein